MKTGNNMDRRKNEILGEPPEYVDMNWWISLSDG